MKLTRIHLHWTAGGYHPTAHDRACYHALIDGDGNEVLGDKPPEANISAADGDYVAHTLDANTGAIGYSACAMLDARERPFVWGPAPLRPIQITALCKMTARAALKYGIKVQRDTILTHAEVQPTLGVKQKGKWDISILPGMAEPGDPIEVGDQLRSLVSAFMRGQG